MSIQTLQQNGTTNGADTVQLDAHVIRHSSEERLGLSPMPANTCPSIDEVIKAIDKAHRIAYDAERECRRYKQDCEHESQFSDVEWELNGLDDKLEELRKQNDAIRSWGYEWKAIAKELIDKYEPERWDDAVSV